MARPNRVKKVKGKPVEIPPREGTAFLSDLVGENIRAAREFASLSKEDLATRMKALGHGWYGPTVTKVERGQRLVTVEELPALALALGVSVYFLLRVEPVGDTEKSQIDLGPDSMIPTLPRDGVDRLYRARATYLPPPPLVTWEGNKPSVWTGENEISLGKLIAYLEDDLGAEAVAGVLAEVEVRNLSELVLRFSGEGGVGVMGPLSRLLSDDLEGVDHVLEALNGLYRARDTDTEES